MIQSRIDSKKEQENWPLVLLSCFFKQLLLLLAPNDVTIVFLQWIQVKMKVFEQ